jgi:hypothetical protein
LLYDTLLDMGFKPSKADYVCLYVDDLIAIMKHPKGFFEELERRGFGLKGVSDTPDVFLG